MFKHILVPLVGSDPAEAALPVPGALARPLGASVTLVHVIERGAPQQVHAAGASRGPKSPRCRPTSERRYLRCGQRGFVHSAYRYSACSVISNPRSRAIFACRFSISAS